MAPARSRRSRRRRRGRRGRRARLLPPSRSRSPRRRAKRSRRTGCSSPSGRPARGAMGGQSPPPGVTGPCCIERPCCEKSCDNPAGPGPPVRGEQMSVTPQMVKELRERTGAGMMDCKNALLESKGDIEQAIDVLRTKGLASAAKKAGRVTAEGAVGSYIHAGGKIGVLVEVNCETDFVARTDDFQELVRDIAMHIAAADPRFVRREEVTEDVLARERAVQREKTLAEGKPEKVVDKIVEGRMEKFFAEQVLLEHPCVKGRDKTVGELGTAKVAKIGDNGQVLRFSRFKLGEGIEKKVGDFAAEVAAQGGTAVRSRWTQQ